jgi:hypothetical protein
LCPDADRRSQFTCRPWLAAKARTTRTREHYDDWLAFLMQQAFSELCRFGQGLDAVEHRVQRDFERFGLALDLTLLTKAWAAEFGPSGVRVNAVSPGPTRTEGTEPMGDLLDQLASLAPAGPEEIASAISYLAGEQASFVHGAVLDVDGGRNAA